MAIRLKRESLLYKLQQAAPALAVRELMEQSASFVFRDRKIIAFNDEILIEVDCDCGFTGAVHSGELLALLAKMGEDEVELSVQGGELIVAGKNNRAGIKMNSEILLKTDVVENPTEWNELDKEFTDAIEVVHASASKDDLTFALMCVHLTSKYIEASDGFQMTRYLIDTPLKEDCLIKRETAKNMVGLALNKIAEGVNWIHFRSDDLRFSCRRWAQQYLDLDEVINFQGKQTTLPGGLAEAVEKAEIFSADKATENQVLVELKPDKLRIRGEGAHGWYEERKKIAYQGDNISFMIQPKLLTEITRRTNDCQITAERLKIDAGKFVFVATLSVVNNA